MIEKARERAQLVPLRCYHEAAFCWLRLELSDCSWETCGNLYARMDGWMGSCFLLVVVVVRPLFWMRKIQEVGCFQTLVSIFLVLHVEPVSPLLVYSINSLVKEWFNLVHVVEWFGESARSQADHRIRCQLLTSPLHDPLSALAIQDISTKMESN